MVQPFEMVERSPITALVMVALAVLAPWAMMASVTWLSSMMAGGSTRGEVYIGLWGS